MIKTISRYASTSEVTNLNQLLTSLSSTVICRIALGKRYEEEGTERSMFHRLFSECEATIGGILFFFFFSYYISFMGWVDTPRGLRTVGFLINLNVLTTIGN